jgi:hypothetical protein
MSEDHVHEDHIYEEEPIPQPPQPQGPYVVYKVLYQNKKGQIITIEDVRGFQFDRGFYFIFVEVEGMPAPEVRVLDLSSNDVRNVSVIPVRLINIDA